jgi:hypothetical protein
MKIATAIKEMASRGIKPETIHITRIKGKVTGFWTDGKTVNRLACSVCGYPDPGGAVMTGLPCPNCN